MGYRENILARIKDDPDHPIKHGIKMQAHHIVSRKGLEASGLSEKLAHLGYRVDEPENLVLLPGTLQGACHLGVQLHRGDHAHTDDEHPESYHDAVKVLLMSIERYVAHGIACDVTAQQVQKKINRISGQLLIRIARFQLPLTRACSAFSRLGPGCCGVDSLPELVEIMHSKSCPTGRDHNGQSAVGQANERIAYKHRSYQLKAGK